jgi:hypothetical protein
LLRASSWRSILRLVNVRLILFRPAREEVGGHANQA